MSGPFKPDGTQHTFIPEVEPHDANESARFSGTENPREIRALALLLRRSSVTREDLDREVGCSNGPDLIARLRDRGLTKVHLPCTRIHELDRDGKSCRRGVYWLTQPGRRAVDRWNAKRKVHKL
jgi:hypothetical protein